MGGASVEELSAALVREFLNRRGCKATLETLEREMPRTEKSISSRAELVRSLKVERLVRKNKESDLALGTVLEVIVRYLSERRSSAEGDDKAHDPPATLSPRSELRSEARDISPKSQRDVLREGKERMLSAETTGTKGASASGTGRRLQRDREPPSSLTVTGLSATDKTSVRPVEFSSPRSRGAGETSGHPPIGGGLGGLHGGGNSREFAGLRGLDGRDGRDGRDYGEVSRLGVGEISLEDLSPPHHGSARRPSSKETPGRTGGSSSVSTQLPQPSNQRSTHGMPKGNIDEMQLLDIDDDDVEEGKAQSPPRRGLGPLPSAGGSSARDGGRGGGGGHALIPPVPVSADIALQLKRLVFGAGSATFGPEWRKQSFVFSDLPDLRYGIVQHKGGPCGVLAAVQAHVLRHLLFPDGGDGASATKKRRPVLAPSDVQRNEALTSAISEILWRCGDQRSATVAMPGRGGGGSSSNFNAHYKPDKLTEVLVLHRADSLEALQSLVRSGLWAFQGENGDGCCLFLYSAILSRGIDKIKADMDEESGRLMGAHGYCTQEMVNLLLTGRACSNVFDGDMTLDSGGETGSLLKGVRSQSAIGFLSLFEHYDSVKVGNFLKNPKHPLWVVCSESHFSVLFCADREPIANARCKKFDIYYYDGLARQDEEIRLTVDTASASKGHAKDDLVPPLEHCIRTRWLGASVSWNGSEPIL